MNWQDLPNGARNLRLYTYDPPGSTYYKPPGEGFIYNTGHYDLYLPGGPCSQVDSQGFNDWDSMSNYIRGRGEWGAVLVSRDDLNSLCAARPPVTPSPTVLPIGPGGSTTGGGVTPVSVMPGPGDTYVPPPPGAVITGVPPGTPGALPPGTTVGQTPGGGGLSQTYRFILYEQDPRSPGTPYQTGANYPGCSPSNTANCDPQAFASELAAVHYAESRHEVPYRVRSAQEVWDLIAGKIAINPDQLLGSYAPQGMGTGTLVLIGLGLWFLSGR